jgi:hypothetical protein
MEMNSNLLVKILENVRGETPVCWRLTGTNHEILITPYGVDERIANGIFVVGKLPISLSS